MERTTDLAKIKNGIPFVWGEAIQLHSIGEYNILEYHPWKTKGSSILAGNPDDSKEFHCWVNGKDCCRSCDSLDAAIAECIAYKYEGANSQAGFYFMRMIKIKEEE